MTDIEKLTEFENRIANLLEEIDILHTDFYNDMKFSLNDFDRAAEVSTKLLEAVVKLRGSGESLIYIINDVRARGR